MPSFTTNYKGRGNVLINDIDIIDPTKTRYQNIKYTPNLHIKVIWDTGATNSVITHNLIEKLLLEPTGQKIINHGGGQSTRNTYLVDIALPNKVIIQDVTVTEGSISSGIDALIGMDIIGLGDFAVSNFEGKTSFTYRIPSKEKFDFVKAAKTPKTSIKYDRNKSCPCGSGKKYKHCTCAQYH